MFFSHAHNLSFMIHMLNLLGLFCLLMEQFYRSKTSAWKKHPHALHSRAVRLEYNQTIPLVRKLMTDLEDKTDHLQVF